MLRILIGLALLVGGCVFQESPEIPANLGVNNTTNNLTNNLTTNNASNNASNNATNNTTNNATNNATNNTTNNTTNSSACVPAPDFCEGYFHCGQGVFEPEVGPICDYNCGTCSGSSVCNSSTDLCTIASEILFSPGARFALEFAPTRKGMAVLWQNYLYGVLNPDGTFRDLDFGLGSGAVITAISASATLWVALGQDSKALVVVGSNDGSAPPQELTGSVGSGFGHDIALAQIDEFGNAPGGIGVVGAPGAADAFIISKTGGTDWAIVGALAEEAGLSPTDSFGESVEISPNGKTVLVESSRGIEVFVKNPNTTGWSHDQTLPVDLPMSGFKVGDAYVVVASSKKLNFYSIRTDNRVDSTMTSVLVTNTGSLVDVDMISAGNGRTVVFAMVDQSNDLVVHMWQPAAPTWIRTHTIVASDLPFTQILDVEAGVFDGPTPASSFPVFVVSGFDNNSLKLQLVPLFPADASAP